LSSQRENKRINMKTKGIYICIYIFQVAMFLKTGVYIYLYIYIYIYACVLLNNDDEYLTIKRVVNKGIGKRRPSTGYEVT